MRERLGERGQPTVAGTRGGAQAGGATQGGPHSPRTGWDGTHAGGAGSGARGSVVNSGGERARRPGEERGSPPRTRGGGFFFLFSLLFCRREVGWMRVTSESTGPLFIVKMCCKSKPAGIRYVYWPSFYTYCESVTRI